MPDLFTLPEFVSYLQIPEFDTLTATLARELATTKIRMEAGPAAYDNLTDVSGLKGVGLDLAKRIVSNPQGLRSVAIDDYTETYASETITSTDLTQAERDQIAQFMGTSSTSFTIRPFGSPDDVGWAPPQHYLRSND